MWKVFMCKILQAPCKFFSWCYVWKIISSLALWIIWKARCSKIYNVEQTNVANQVKSFWELLVNTVKGDYDSYKGYRNVTNRKRRRIQRVWSAIPIMLDVCDDVKWNYVPPRWLFPPSASFLLHTTWLNRSSMINIGGFGEMVQDSHGFYW